MDELGLVLMRVDTIVVDPQTSAPVMVLRGEQDDELYLPISIGQLEAAAIASVMADFVLPRPMTHDLFSTVVEQIGGQIDRVTITRLEDDTFYAEITLIDLRGETHVIDARPSDSVALGLRANAPIYVAETVLAEAGGYVTDDEGEEETTGAENTLSMDSTPTLSSSDVRLEDLDADTFGKYKM